MMMDQKNAGIGIAMQIPINSLPFAGDTSQPFMTIELSIAVSIERGDMRKRRLASADF